MNTETSLHSYSSILRPRQPLIFAVLAACCLCTSVTYPPPNDYNYAATTLVNVASQNNKSFEVDVNFDFHFRGITHRKFWANSNSIIYFGDQSLTPFGSVLNSGYPRLEVNAQDQTAVRIIVRSTGAKVTVLYSGQQSFFLLTYSINWLVTFYKDSNELLWTFSETMRTMASAEYALTLLAKILILVRYDLPDTPAY